jgi:hypothetical protein
VTIARLRTQEIGAAVRKERLRLVKDAPEPVVINLDAVLTIGQSREVQWGAIKLHAPPLDFKMGARLYVSAHALHDLREREAPTESIKAAQFVVAALLRQAVKPARGRDRLRCWHCVFLKDSPEELEQLIHWLLHVPDEAGYVPPKQQVTIDFMDNVATFAKAFPGWMKDGWPMSWAHYQYGMRHLGRAWAREELRTASATRMAQTQVEDFKPYVLETKAAAGWVNG